MGLILCGRNAVSRFGNHYRYGFLVVIGGLDELDLEMGYGAVPKEDPQVKARAAELSLQLIFLVLICVSVALCARTTQYTPHRSPSEDGDKSVVVACSPDEAAIEEGQGVAVRAWASSVAGRTLTYRWSATVGVIRGSTQEVTWDMSTVEPGTYQIDVTVSDGSTFTGDCSVHVDVVEVDRSFRESGREYLIREAQESPGYGLYSYLLFGSSPTVSTRERYLKVLEAYVAFNKIASLQAVSYRPNELNITYLPLKTQAKENASAPWLLDNYDFPRARRLLSFLGGGQKGGIYFVSSSKPLSRRSPPFLIQNLTNLPVFPGDLISWWVRVFLNQAAQEHFWEPRATQLLALRLRTAIAVLATGLPEVKRSLDSWIYWKK